VTGPFFTYALSWVGAEEMLPIMQILGPEIHHKTTELDGFTIQ